MRETSSHVLHRVKFGSLLEVGDVLCLVADITNDNKWIKVSGWRRTVFSSICSVIDLRAGVTQIHYAHPSQHALGKPRPRCIVALTLLSSTERQTTRTLGRKPVCQVYVSSLVLHRCREGRGQRCVRCEPLRPHEGNGKVWSLRPVPQNNGKRKIQTALNCAYL